MKAEAKPKDAALLWVSADEEPEIYKSIAKLVEEAHDDLATARIQVVWKMNWREDARGSWPSVVARVEDELHWRGTEVDVFLLINKPKWESALTDPLDRLFAIDQALCSAVAQRTKEGGHREDSTGRKIYTGIKGDVHLFLAPIERHGLRSKEAQTFWARAKAAQLALPFAPEAKPPEPSATAPRVARSTRTRKKATAPAKKTASG